MPIDMNPGAVFMTARDSGGRVIRHLEKHQDVATDFWYVDTHSGRHFDVRDFTDEMRGDVARDDILSADRAAHKRAIRNALDSGHELAPEPAARRARP